MNKVYDAGMGLVGPLQQIRDLLHNIYFEQPMLRDLFAMRVMHTLEWSPLPGKHDVAQAIRAYQIADAMMVARKGEPG